jgi:hypothetical protein
MRFFLTSIVAGGLLLGSLGCGQSNACITPASPGAFELGTGDTCFQRLKSGQTVPVNDGPQGGFHLWTAVGCADCGATVPVELGVKDAMTKQWLESSPLRLVAELTGDPWGQLAGMTAFLPGDAFDPMKKLAKGTHVLLTASALKTDGSALHTAEVELVLGDDQDSSCSTDASCGGEGLSPCCGANDAL